MNLLEANQPEQFGDSLVKYSLESMSWDCLNNNLKMSDVKLGKLTNFYILFLKVFKRSIYQFESPMFRMIPYFQRGTQPNSSSIQKKLPGPAHLTNRIGPIPHSAQQIQQIKPQGRMMPSIMQSVRFKNSQTFQDSNNQTSSFKSQEQSHPNINFRPYSQSGEKKQPIIGNSHSHQNNLQYKFKNFQSNINQPENRNQSVSPSQNQRPIISYQQNSFGNLNHQPDNVQNSSSTNNQQQYNNGGQPFSNNNRPGFLNSSIHQSSSKVAQLYFSVNPNIHSAQGVGYQGNNPQRVQNIQNTQVGNTNQGNLVNQEGYLSQQIYNQHQNYQYNENKEQENGRKDMGTFCPDFNKKEIDHQVVQPKYQQDQFETKNEKPGYLWQNRNLESEIRGQMQYPEFGNQNSMTYQNNCRQGRIIEGLKPIFELIGNSNNKNKEAEAEQMIDFGKYNFVMPERKEDQDQWWRKTEIKRRRTKDPLVVIYKIKSEQQKKRQSYQYFQMLKKQKEQWCQAQFSISYDQYCWLQRNQFKNRDQYRRANRRSVSGKDDKKEKPFSQQQVQVSQFETREVQYIIDLRWVQENEKIRSVFPKSKVYVSKRPKRPEIKQAILEDLRRMGVCLNRKYLFEERNFDYQREKPNFLMKWVFGKKDKCLKNYTFEGSILEYKIDLPEGYEYSPKSFKGFMVNNLMIRNEFGWVQWPGKVDIEGVSFIKGFSISKQWVNCQINKLKKIAIAEFFSVPENLVGKTEDQIKKYIMEMMKAEWVKLDIKNRTCKIQLNL